MNNRYTILLGNFCFFDDSYDDYNPLLGDRYTIIDKLLKIDIVCVSYIKLSQICENYIKNQYDSYIILEEYDGKIYFNNDEIIIGKEGIK